MANEALVLFETSPLELWKARGGGLARVLHRLIPEAVVKAFECIATYQRLLASYVGTQYSPERVSDAIDDDALTDASTKAAEAVSVLMEGSGRLARMRTPVWMLAGWRTLLDRQLSKRIERAINAANEVAEIARKSDLDAMDRELHIPPRELRRDNTAWFVYDATIPTEVSKRLLAGRRARLIMDLVQAARHRDCWSRRDVKQALTDWADTLEYALGLWASYPGITVPSLPRTQIFDLPGELAKHSKRRERLAREAQNAANELKK